MATLVGLGALAAEQLVKLAMWRTDIWTDVAGSIVQVLS
jgi:hypothetical protein